MTPGPDPQSCPLEDTEGQVSIHFLLMSEHRCLTSALKSLNRYYQMADTGFGVYRNISTSKRYTRRPTTIEVWKILADKA